MTQPTDTQPTPTRLTPTQAREATPDPAPSLLDRLWEAMSYAPPGMTQGQALTWAQGRPGA